MKSNNPNSGIYEADTARTIDMNGGSPTCNQGGVAIVQEMAEEFEPKEASVYSIGHDIRSAKLTDDEITDPLTANDYKDPQIVTYGSNEYIPCVTGALSPGAHPGGFNGQDAYNGMLVCEPLDDAAMAVDCRNGREGEINGTLQSKKEGYNLNTNNVCRISSVVRRLTPTECERLQGFPDGWTDIGEWVDTKGKVHKPADSPRYKALGNSIATPFWFWMLRRISAMYERPATLGSLFDGIGGFPYCWERCNGKGTAIWASEIEEFPIAVTKRHFPEEDEEKEGK